VIEAVDADLIAEALAWAADAPPARNQTFNITNGDVYVWENVWPAIAESLGLEPAFGRPVRLSEFLPAHAEVWDRIVASHGLKPIRMAELVGESHITPTCCSGGGLRPDPADPGQHHQAAAGGLWRLHRHRSDVPQVAGAAGRAQGSAEPLSRAPRALTGQIASSVSPRTTWKAS